jgi:phosphate transport system protein
MVRELFASQMEALKMDVGVLGSYCENILELASQSLNDNSSLLAGEIKILDERIENKGREIENNCLTLLIKQQPVASDLRLISASLKIIHDCKRIGDQAVNISELFAGLTHKPEQGLPCLRQMALGTKNLVQDSMEAFNKWDIDLARSARHKDDAIDQLFADSKQELLKLIRSGTDNGEAVLSYLLIAKYFEKISDHAVHIAVWVMFAVTGERE